MFREGDVVTTKRELRHLVPTRDPLPPDTEGVVTKVINGGTLIAVDFGEITERVVRPDALTNHGQPRAVEGWDEVALFQRWYPASTELLVYTPIKTASEH
jgi:hypothetical protein